MRQDGLREPPLAEQVGVELAPDLGLVHVLDRAVEAVAGVVDHHVYAAEVGDRLRNHPFDGGAIRDIE
jgi:hypothetical protein